MVIGRAFQDRNYDPMYFSILFKIESRHFWFRARNEIIGAVMKNLIADAQNDCRMLEVGCGTGNVLKMLEQACPGWTVVGMDLFFEGLHYARQRSGSLLIQGDICEPPFGAQFDLIGLFDVLEHVPDDRRILRNMVNLLTEKGKLVLTVPAHPSLWSYFDEMSHHCRRYKPAELKDKLTLAGYRVEYLTPYMAAIFPLLWLWRKCAPLVVRRRPGDEGHSDRLAHCELLPIPILNELMALFLRQERHVIARRFRLPIGTSILCIAGKNRVEN